jgi:hypothetical protein
VARVCAVRVSSCASPLGRFHTPDCKHVWDSIR